MLYAQSSQESNNKTEFSTKIAHNSTVIEINPDITKKKL